MAGCPLGSLKTVLVQASRLHSPIHHFNHSLSIHPFTARRLGLHAPIHHHCGAKVARPNSSCRPCPMHRWPPSLSIIPPPLPRMSYSIRSGLKLASSQSNLTPLFRLHYALLYHSVAHQHESPYVIRGSLSDGGGGDGQRGDVCNDRQVMSVIGCPASESHKHTSVLHSPGDFCN
jgi:hypothetical protein